MLSRNKAVASFEKLKFPPASHISWHLLTYVNVRTFGVAPEGRNEILNFSSRHFSILVPVEQLERLQHLGVGAHGELPAVVATVVVGWGHVDEEGCLDTKWLASRCSWISGLSNSWQVCRAADFARPPAVTPNSQCLSVRKSAAFLLTTFDGIGITLSWASWHHLSPR